MVAFAAGFIDAIVGGGGLVQTPASLVLLRSFPVATVIGSLKIPSFSGTYFAARQYLRKVNLKQSFVTLLCVVAFFASFAGSQLLTIVSNQFMKPLLLVVLTAVAIYTYTKKDFGQQEVKSIPHRMEIKYGVLISFLLGFYDGFIGPGAGSFLILAFITLLGYDFLRASAQAKLINLSTNLGSIILFTLKGKIIWMVALPMAVFNAFGGMLGARLAITRGNKFIRKFFLFVVIITLMRYLWDVVRG